MQIRDVVLIPARFILSRYNRKCGNGLWLKASVFLPLVRIADSAPETLHNWGLGLICEEQEVFDVVMHCRSSSTAPPRAPAPQGWCCWAGLALEAEKQNIKVCRTGMDGWSLPGGLVVLPVA